MKKAACLGPALALSISCTLGTVWAAPSPAPVMPEDASQPDRPSSDTKTESGSPSSATKNIVNNATLDDGGVKDGVSPAILRAEVMLDRLDVSPGVIDGRDGANFEHALGTFERMRHLKVTKGLDKKVWDALVESSGAPVLVDHVLTADEVAGPFFPDLPKDYAELAKLKTIGYRSPAQKIGAEFHLGEGLLAALNPGVNLAKAGTRILVTDVDATPVRGRLKRIIVDKHTRQVIGYDAKGHILIAVPATIGSRELPSPSGTYKVKGVAWNPVYYYDPKNFVQGDNKDKLELPPGPNNPVGSVFIALTKPTYGLHGTPDPSKIDKTASHGCVRMTNWDARELAHLVRRGIVVHFRS